MSNENENVDIIEDEDIDEGQDPTEDELNDDGTDWKAKYLQERGISKRRATKLAKLKETTVKKEEKKEQPTIESKKSDKSEDLNYGELAFYNSKSEVPKIETDDDIEFLKDTLKETGKSQMSILNSKWFQNELKERQEDKAVKYATPKSTSQRKAPVTIDSVNYWLEKGGLPDDQELKVKVVNARIAKEKGANNAPGSSVVSNIGSSSGIEIR